MQLPRIAGVGGGVGTSTLAAALRARDGGIYRGGDVVDVLVARSTMFSLGCAQRAIAATPEPPVLAVVADLPGGSLPGMVKARLRMTEPHVAAVVMVPFVGDWRELDTPIGEAANVLAADPPRALRGFAEAMLQLVDEITPRLLHRSAAGTGFHPAGPAAGYPTAAYPDPVPAGWPTAR